MIIATLWASSSYGTAAKVALGTDWAFTVADDSNYESILNITALSFILSLVFTYMAHGNMQRDFDNQTALLKEEAQFAKEEARKDLFSGDCPAGMEDKDGLCYYREDHDWDWGF